MILSFKKTFPWGEPTNFRQKILDGTKIHTIRVDPHDRWKEGNKVHCANGVRTKNYNCFYEGICTGVQDIEIKYHHHIITGKTVEIFIDGFSIPWGMALNLFGNDGFDGIEDFLKWFNEPVKAKLIHWTDFKY